MGIEAEHQALLAVDGGGIGDVELVEIGRQRRQRADEAVLQQVDVAVIEVNVAKHVLQECAHAFLVSDLVHALAAHACDNAALRLRTAPIVHVGALLLHRQAEDGLAANFGRVHIFLQERETTKQRSSLGGMEVVDAD